LMVILRSSAKERCSSAVKNFALASFTAPSAADALVCLNASDLGAGVLVAARSYSQIFKIVRIQLPVVDRRARVIVNATHVKKKEKQFRKP
jgi:hypothetical protein